MANTASKKQKGSMERQATILILLFAAVGAHGHALSQEYPFSAKLAGEDYILHWSSDFQNNNLAAAVNVSTTGWVGFGLSPNGQMPGSDVIIAWVNSDGEVQFKVRYNSVLLYYIMGQIPFPLICRIGMQMVVHSPLLIVAKIGFLSVVKSKMEGQL